MSPARLTKPRTLAVLGTVAAVLFALILAAVPPLTATAAPPDGPDKLADFETALPPGWFVFNGGGSSVTATPATVADADAAARPAQVGDNGLLDVSFDVTDFGGFGQDVSALGGPQNWSTTEGLSFWFRGTNSGLTLQAEIADNRSDPTTDTAERFDVDFVDDSTEWRRITLPWSDFTRATDFQPGGAPDDGLTLTEVWSWAIVLPNGAAAFQIDDVGVDDHVVDDFEDLSPGGLPSGTDSDGLGVGWLNFADPSGNTTVATAVEQTPPTPLTTEFGSDNQALAVRMKVESFAGVVHAFSNDSLDAWVPQDWSAWEGLAFWLHGEGTGNDLFLDLIENRNPGSTTDDAERWSITLKDDVSGW
nr:hypothetical protein [Candidatus Nanopelagicales bacterium]